MSRFHAPGAWGTIQCHGKARQSSNPCLFRRGPFGLTGYIPDYAQISGLLVQGRSVQFLICGPQIFLRLDLTGSLLTKKSVKMALPELGGTGNHVLVFSMGYVTRWNLQGWASLARSPGVHSGGEAALTRLSLSSQGPFLRSLTNFALFSRR